MSDDLKKVVTGEKFRPSSRTWNSFVDAARANKMRMFDLEAGTGSTRGETGIVPVRNDSGADLNQYAVLSLDTLLITPTDNLDDFLQRPPVFSGKAISTDNLTKPFAIIQEPIKDTFIGFAMITGVTPVKINIMSEADAFAKLSATGLESSSSGIVRILWKESGTGSKWAMVHFPTGGGGSSYTLFEVVKDGDTAIKVNGYNVEAGRYARNLIILGLTTIELTDGAPCTGITYTGVLYIQVIYSSGYAATLQFASALPTQDNSHIYHYLADIVCVDGKISQIIQPPTSVIHYAGRVL